MKALPWVFHGAVACREWSGEYRHFSVGQTYWSQAGSIGNTAAVLSQPNGGHYIFSECCDGFNSAMRFQDIWLDLAWIHNVTVSLRTGRRQCLRMQVSNGTAVLSASWLLHKYRSCSHTNSAKIRGPPMHLLDRPRHCLKRLCELILGNSVRNKFYLRATPDNNL